MKKSIIITNDDGIHEPGIFHLAQCLMPYFEITIVAPSTQQSGKGLGITLHHPLQIEKVDFSLPIQAYKVNGTPADCVKMGISKLLPKAPDFVISGINPGDNSGRNALYSGTVGATIEGALRGIPGIAFSCLDFDKAPFEEFTRHIPSICEYFIQNPLPNGTIINVNCPLKSKGIIQGIKLATQGLSYWCENTANLNSAPIFDHDHYLGASFHHYPEKETSDVHLLGQGFITAVPINVSTLTNENHFQEESIKFQNFTNPIQSFSF